MTFQTAKVVSVGLQNLQNFRCEMIDLVVFEKNLELEFVHLIGIAEN
jgi:hypothetical protein